MCCQHEALPCDGIRGSRREKKRQGLELAGRGAIGALLRLGFFVLACCAFAGLWLIVDAVSSSPSRALLEPFPWADDPNLPHHEVRCAPQQDRSANVSLGSESRLPENGHGGDESKAARFKK
jgi:hypothetical protein